MSKKRRRTFVREWREYRDLSQDELADRAGITKGNVSQLERALISYRQDTFERIAVALDCSVVDLLTRTPNQAQDLLSLWNKATIAKRKTFEEIAKAILNEPSDDV